MNIFTGKPRWKQHGGISLDGNISIENLSQVMNCIACLEDLGSMEWAANIYMMAQYLVAKR